MNRFPEVTRSSGQAGRREPVVPVFLRWAHALFAFSIAFETMGADWTGKYFTPGRLCGYTFCLLTVFYPATCYRRFPKAFLGFGVYLSVFAALGLLADEAHYRELSLQFGLLTMVVIQSLASANLMCSGRVATSSIWAFVTGYSLLVILQLTGVSSTPLEESSRVSAWGLDPNFLAVALSAALIAMVGLLNSPDHPPGALQIVGWVLAGLFLLVIVQTGSRGGSLALLAGLLVLLVSGRGLAAHVKNAVTAVLLLGGLVWQLSVSPAAKERWDETLESGDTSGRTETFEVAWMMFLEKPWLGWGPVGHTYEIGRRFHGEALDTHDILLTILNQTGIVGCAGFLYGAACCVAGAWRARDGRFGMMPLAMLVTMLAGALSLSASFDRVLWFTFAFALARGDSRSTGRRSWFQRLLARWTVWRQLRADRPHPV